MTETLLAALAALQFQFTPVHQYRVLQRAENRNGGVHVHTLSARAENIDVKATIFAFESTQLAEDAMKEQIKRIRAIYDDHPEQYFAMLTRKTKCPSAYQIQSQVDGRRERLKMYANSRNVLGACAADVAVKRADAVFLVCGKRLLKLLKFRPARQPRQSAKDELDSLSCQRQRTNSMVPASSGSLILARGSAPVTRKT